MSTSGYITMQEAIQAAPLPFLANRALLPNLLQILLLFLTVLFDPYILKKQRRIMLVIIALIFSMVGQDLVADQLSRYQYSTPLRTSNPFTGIRCGPWCCCCFSISSNRANAIRCPGG